MSDPVKAKRWPQYLAAVCVCIGALGMGTLIGWTANITEDLRNGTLHSLKMDDHSLGWTGSCMTLGALLVCVPIGFVADWIGRKWSVLITVIPFTVGWVLILFAQHIAMVYIGRLFTGIGAGAFCVVAPLYTSETAETEIRGKLGAFFQLFITIGILYAYVFGFLLGIYLYIIFCLAVPIAFAVLFFFQPESPVYYLKKGKSEQAEKSYKRLRGKDYDFHPEMEDCLAAIAKDKEKQNFWVAMKTKAAKKATLICFMLMFYQQLSGINAIMFYSQDIFTDAGSTLPSHWCVIIIGIVQVVFTVIAAWVIDKLGRKILLMLSGGLMGLSTILLGLFFTLKNHEIISENGIKSIGFLPLLSLIIFIIAFSIGFGPIPWLASSEIFPPDVKANCSSAAAVLNWFLAFLVSRFYPNVATAIGNDITFYVFGAITITSVFFVLFVMPETKNKTFNQIVEELSK